MISWASVHVQTAKDIGDAQVTSTHSYHSVTIPIGPGSPTLLVLNGRETLARMRDVLDKAIRESALQEAALEESAWRE